MTKIRKQRRRKKFRYSVNKKKLKRKIMKGPNIERSEVKKEWEHIKSGHCNMSEMGLVYDVNKALSITTNTNISGRINEKEKVNASKQHVADALLEDARAPRESKVRLPNSQVQWLSYLITKHGEDYKAMSRDPKNYYAVTWKKIRAKIAKFKLIPEQYNEFLKTQSSNSMDTS